MNLRLATPADAADIQAIYAPVVTDTPISFEIVPPSVSEVAARIERTLASFPWIVELDDADRVRGYVYASRFRERAAYQWSVEVTAYVRADARGRGIGRRLYGVLLDELTTLGYCEAFAGITLPNVASVALHESCGFRPAGLYRNAGFKLGRWHDVGTWQRMLQHPDPPAPPRRFSGRLGD